MGKYFAFRNNVYCKKLNIPSINIDNDLSLLQVKKIINSKIKYKKNFAYFYKGKKTPRYNIDKLIFQLNII